MRTFNNLHGTSVGGEAPKGGYPDMGNGRYAANWRYDEWFTFNNWQRAHYNYIEQLTPTIVWILIGCAYRPLASAILGFLYFIGRVVFTVGYSKSSNKRILGALIIDVAFLGLFILSIITIGKWGQFD